MSVSNFIHVHNLAGAYTFMTAETVYLWKPWLLRVHI